MEAIGGKNGTISLQSKTRGGTKTQCKREFFSVTEIEPNSIIHLSSRTMVGRLSTPSEAVRRAASAGLSAIKLSAFYSLLSKSEMFKTGGGVVTVKKETSRTSVAEWTGAGRGVSRRRSGGDNGFFSDGKVERGPSSLEDPAEDASCPRTDTTWL